MVLARLRRSALIVGFLLAAALLPTAFAQEDAAEQSRLQQFLEGMLSTPERQVRIGEMSGLLSSTISIDSIEVADPQGVWLQLEDIELAWNRLALFRGRLEIERLRAERVEWLRRPVGEADAEGGAPSVPLSINIEAVEAPVIEIAEPVAGMHATLSARGSVSAVAEAVEALIEVERLDAPGGTLAAEFAFNPAENLLRADATLREPPGGLVAAFLNLPGRPAIDLRLDGEGPLDDWRAELALAADGQEVLAGEARISRIEDGYRAVADIAGQLGQFAPPAYQALLAGRSRLALDATRQEDGTIRVAQAQLTAEHANLSAEGLLAADFVPRQGRLDLQLSPAPGQPVALPFLPGNPQVQSATIEAELGRDGDEQWSVTATINGLDHERGEAERLIVEASGTAANLALPAERSLTFSVRGEARGIRPVDQEIAAALGERVTLEAQGDWQAGGPVRIPGLALRSEGLSLAFSGSASLNRVEGRYRLEAAELSSLSGIIGRDIAGRLAIDATGTIQPEAETFDLTVNGQASDLNTGIAALDPLLQGDVELRGGVARGADGFRLNDLVVASQAVTARLSGSVAAPALDLSFDAEIDDLARLSERAAGAARLAGRVTGSAEAPRVALRAEGEEIVLMGTPLADARARFEGTISGPQTEGSAELSATLGGVPVEGAAELSGLADGSRRLEELRLRAGRNVAEGELTIRPDGLLEGALSVDAPEIATVAPLFLAEASGAVDVQVRLEAEGGTQAARITGDVSDVRYEDVVVGSAEIDLGATNLFGAPEIEGRFDASQIAVGETEIDSVEGTARREGERTEFDVVATLPQGEAALRGTLRPIPAGFAIVLDALRLSREGQAFRLGEPATLEVRDGAVVLDGLTLLVDGGRVAVTGRAGATLDFDLELADVSASLANAFAPDLEAQGTISGTVEVEGTPAEPRAAFDVDWRGASLRAVREAGLGPFDVEAEGRYADGRLELTADVVSDAGRFAVNATGRIEPDSLELTIDGRGADLNTGIAALDPLLQGSVELRGGIVSGPDGFRFENFVVASQAVTARLSGSVSESALDLSFEANVDDLAQLSDRAAGAAHLTGRITGTADAPRVSLNAEGEEIVLMGQPLADARGRFEGTIAGPQTEGSAELSATLGGVPVEGAAELSGLPDGSRRLQDLRLRAGRNVAEGELTIRPDGLLEGALSIDAPEIATVAPLFLAEASGAVDLEVRLEAEGGSQAARIAGDVRDLRYEEVAVGSADIDLTANDLFTAPEIEGRFAARQIAVGETEIDSIEGTARREGERTEFDVVASLPQGEAALRGTLQPTGGGFAVALDALSLSRQGEMLRLAQPTTLEVRDGTAVLDGLTLLVDGGRAAFTGRAGATLDLNVEMTGISADLANAFAPGLDAQGTISGRLEVEGTPAEPRAVFDLDWRGASVSAAREAGLGPFNVAAEGRYADGTVTLASANLRSDAGLSLTISGTAGLAGAGTLDLEVTGEAPLALASRQLDARATRLSGNLAIDVDVGGTLDNPVFSGTLTTQGAALVDPETGIVLRDIALRARFTDDRLSVESLSARSGEAGTVSGSGSVGLDAGAGYPLDLTLSVRNGRYVDGRLVAATLDADLTVTGPLARPTLGGTVTVDRAEIAVPERLPRDHLAVDVRHIAAPPQVEATVRRAQPRARPADAGGEPSGIILNIVIEAPARIFVRGRGLDVELGGRLALTGPVSDILATGAFDLRRGHIDILTQRVTFERGNLDFAGDLDPVLDFEGTTRSGDIDVTVLVTGRASDPAIEFSSVPELPQEEVLAHLLFRRSLSDLSPLQLARVAAAAAELGGLTEGPGLLQQLRGATGLDVLDIVPDEDGGLAVQAGRYINDNVYLGLQQGATAESSRVTIDLDITRDLKARGELRGDGGSSLGIFYEREY